MSRFIHALGCFEEKLGFCKHGESMQLDCGKCDGEAAESYLSSLQEG